jgi:hypothetical protein
VVDIDVDMTSAFTGALSKVLLWAVPLTLGFGLWAVSSPVGANPDEPAHIIYSWSIATGQDFGDADIACSTGIRPCPRTSVDVPAGLVPSPGCYAFKPDVPAACTTTLDGGTYSTYMVRYPPLYYGVIGASLRIAMAVGFDGATAAGIARMVSVLISITLLAPALALAWSRARRLVPALIVLLTPMTLFMVGAINPSGTEITAAMTVGTALVVLAGSARCRPAQVLTCYGLVWLVWSRPLGFLWAGAIMVFGLAYVVVSERRARPVRDLLRDLVVVLVVAAVNIAGGILWFLYALRGREGGSVEDSNTLPDSGVESFIAIVLRWGGMMWENLGVLGWLDTTLPLALMLASAIALALVVWEPLTSPDADFGRRRITAGYLVGIVVGTSLIMIYQEFLWQGRYVLPALAAGYLLAVGASPTASPRRMFHVATAAWVVGVLGAMWFYARHVYGIQEGARYEVPNVSAGAQWLGPLGGPGYVLAAIVAVVSLPAAFVTAHRRDPAITGAD